jgi:hypothetical protein
MIVNARDKLKSWAGLACLFSKRNIMQTNLPCKQIEKTGNVATPRPPPKKNKNDRPKAPKGPQQQGEKKEKGKHEKKKVLLIVPLPKRCKATKNRLKAPHHP